MHLLQAWRESESSVLERGLSGDPAMVDAMMPKKVKMRRMAVDDGQGQGDSWEEYYDYIFPDDEKKIGKKLCSIWWITVNYTTWI